MISSQTFVWSSSRVPPSLHGGLQHSAQHFFHYLHFIFPLPCLPQPPIHCVSGWNARCQGLHRLLMVSWWRSGQNTAAYFYIHLSHQLRSPSRLFPRNFYVKCLILNLACFWYNHFKCLYGPRLCMRPSSSAVWPWRCLHHLRHSVTASPCCDVMWCDERGKRWQLFLHRANCCNHSCCSQPVIALHQVEELKLSISLRFLPFHTLYNHLKSP